MVVVVVVVVARSTGERWRDWNDDRRSARSAVTTMANQSKANENRGQPFSPLLCFLLICLYLFFFCFLTRWL